MAVQTAVRAADLLADYLAVVRRGAPAPSAVAARRAVGGRSGGASLVEGTAIRTSAEEAALLNGIAAHSIELDDTYERGSVHPGVAVWPAVLALNDELDREASAVLDAAVLGYDLTCELSDRLGPARAYARGFHPTGVCGVVGAAAASAELLGLDADVAAQAVGIAASMAGGLLAFLDEGAWTKPLHAGRAAEGGVRAARLAAAGFRGPTNAIEGPHGLLHAFGGPDPIEPAARPRGHGVMSTAIKLYPTCRYTHGCIDLLLELGVEPGDVAEVHCSVLDAGWDLVAAPIERKRMVAGAVDAQFSMPFAAAVAIDRGSLTLEHVEHAARLAPDLAPLMARVQCRRDAELDAAYPDSWGAAVSIRRRDGELMESRARDPIGSPARPVSRERILAKAGELLDPEWAGAAGELLAGLRPEAPLATTLACLRPAVPGGE